MTSIFTKILYLMEKNIDTMLVTIVSHEGSAPRGTGSQMLVEARGRVSGTIGGGPTEKEAETLACQLLKEKRSLLHTYVLRKNEVEDIGSICGGDVTVWFQYIAAGDSVWKDLAGKLCDTVAQKKRAWFVQRLDGGAPALLEEGGAAFWGAAPENAQALCGDGSVLNGQCFSMLLPVGERAVIFGAGHCALALCPVLASVGFRVTIFDNRPEYARAEYFPQAENVICGDFEQIEQHITLTSSDYLVVMTSGHSFDFTVQEQVLRTPHAYVGVIGSKKKTAAVNARLREKNVPQEAIEQVYTPVGLAIKAVTPEEIAVSIAAEMILVRAQYREQAGTYSKACPMH